MSFIGELGLAGLAKETTLGTFVSPARFMRFRPPFDMQTDIALIQSMGTQGIPDLHQKAAQGKAQLNPGKIGFEVEPECIGDHLMAAFGTDTVTEVASFKVTTGSNDTLDFNIGASQLSATVAAGTYVAGQTQADTGSLCALLYNAIHAAEAVGTYTVTYARSTGLFTITRSSGTLVLMFHTGTNTAKSIGPLIGFLTDDDDSGALTYSGDTVMTPAWSHAFSRVASALLPSYSWWQYNGVDYPQHAGCMLNKLDFDFKSGDFVLATGEWKGLKYVSGGTSKSAIFSNLNAFKFDQAVLSVISGPTNYSDLKLTIDNKVAVEHVVGSTIYGQKIFSGGLAAGLSGTLFFEDNTEWNKFIAGTASGITLTLTSAQTIGTAAVPYTLTFVLPTLYYKKFPKPLSKGLIKCAFSADAEYTPGSSATIQPTLVNTQAYAGF